MKKIIYLLSILFLSMGVSSCDQKIDYPYTGKDRIQFKFFDTDNNGKRTEFKKQVRSLGLLNDTILVDTTKVVMELLGRLSDRERTYKIAVVSDSTTAKSGIHYQVLNEIQKFRPGKTTDTLRILINRESLSDNYFDPQDEFLYLKLEPTEDFDSGLTNGCQMKFILNNYLTEPRWWEPNFFGSLGFFHPKKWKILIDFTNEFATYGTLGITYNDSKGKEYKKGLESYLNAVPTYDDYTGDRIYLNRLVPQE